MPRYDYDCAACGRRFEVTHGVTADDPTTCPLCGSGPVRKAISAAAVHFKGSGWAKKERRAPSTSGASKAASETASTSEGGAAEPAAKRESGSPETATPAPSKSAEAGAASSTD